MGGQTGAITQQTSTSGAGMPQPAQAAPSAPAASINNGFGGYNGQSAANAMPQQNPYQPPQQPWQNAASNSPLGVPNNPWMFGGPAAVAARQTPQTQPAPQVQQQPPAWGAMQQDQLPPGLSRVLEMMAERSRASTFVPQQAQQMVNRATPVLQDFQQLQASQARGRALEGQGDKFFSWGDRRFL